MLELTNDGEKRTQDALVISDETGTFRFDVEIESEDVLQATWDGSFPCIFQDHFQVVVALGAKVDLELGLSFVFQEFESVGVPISAVHTEGVIGTVFGSTEIAEEVALSIEKSRYLGDPPADRTVCPPPLLIEGGRGSPSDVLEEGLDRSGYEEGEEGYFDLVFHGIPHEYRVVFL